MIDDLLQSPVLKSVLCKPTNFSFSPNSLILAKINRAELETLANYRRPSQRREASGTRRAIHLGTITKKARNSRGPFSYVLAFPDRRTHRLHWNN
jgi:hypothetical protein